MMIIVYSLYIAGSVFFVLGSALALAIHMGLVS